METAMIVKVAVSAAPYSIDKPYDYLVPDALLESAVPGVRVTVPFGRGNRQSEGIILARGTGEKIPGLKPLTGVLDQEPVLDSDGIALALWMRQRYFCTLFEAV
jgi:primosomal protein N' (replication factor Y)